MTKAQKEAASKLNPRQRKFCELYVKYGNITKAAVEAGYSQKHAEKNGKVILESKGVRAYIKALTTSEEKEERKRIADAEETMEFFTRTMRGEIKDQFDLDAPIDIRLRAAIEIAKRKVDTAPVEARVTIVNDIPRGEKK